MTNSDHGSSSGGEGSHHTSTYESPHVIFSLMLILSAGTFFLFNLRRVKLPYTVVMFGFGIIMGLLGNAYDGTTYGDIFYGLDLVSPHAAFHVFLPILIFEGAYAIKTHAFWSVFSIVLLLAGPGVLINAALIGLSMMPMYPNWSIYMCGLLGSILSSTDPVAVVALLKDLGVDKRLTAVVDGEAVSNDGTAIILFLILLPAAKVGYITATGPQVLWECFRLVVIAIIFGTFTGFIAKKLMEIAKSDHHIQPLITISMAYITFFVADVWLSTSGVLAIVCTGIYLATMMPTHFPGKEGSPLNIVWHFLVHSANTALFAIVGVIIGREVFPYLDLANIAQIFYLYVACTIARFTMVMSMTPLYRYFNKSYSIGVKEAMLLTHGGLRGGVGMMLALLVYEVSGDDAGLLGEAERTEMLILTAGMVVLTMCVNAPTSGIIVEMLGHKAKDKNRLLQMEMGVKRLQEASQKAIRHAKVNPLYAGTNWDTVEEVVLSKLDNPYKGLKAVKEEDDRVYNVLLMRAFKSRVWQLRDNGSITEGAGVILTGAASKCIEEGRLITTEDIVELMSPPLLLRVLTYIFFKAPPTAAPSGNANGALVPPGPNASESAAHHNAEAPAATGGTASNHHSDVDDIEMDRSSVAPTEFVTEDGQRKKKNKLGKLGANVGAKFKSLDKATKTAFYDPKSDFIPDDQVLQRRNVLYLEEIQKGIQKTASRVGVGSKPAKDEDGTKELENSRWSSHIEKLILKWRLHVEGEYYAVFIGYSEALGMIQRTYKEYALHRTQAQRASVWLAEEVEITNRKIDMYTSKRPKTICAFMTHAAATHVAGDVVEAAENLRSDLGYALSAAEALMHSCHNIQHSLDKWPAQIENLSNTDILLRSAIMSGLPQNEIPNVTATTKELHFENGGVIDLENCVAVIVQGVVKAFGSYERHRGPGDCFNAASAVSRTTGPEYLVTSKTATVIAVPYSVLQELYGKNSGTMRAMLMVAVSEAIAPAANELLIPCLRMSVEELCDIFESHGRVIIAPNDKYLYAAHEMGGMLQPASPSTANGVISPAKRYGMAANPTFQSPHKVPPVSGTTLAIAAGFGVDSSTVAVADHIEQRKASKSYSHPSAGQSVSVKAEVEDQLSMTIARQGASRSRSRKGDDGSCTTAEIDGNTTTTFIKTVAGSTVTTTTVVSTLTTLGLLTAIANTRREYLFFVTGSSQDADIKGGITSSVGPCIIPHAVATRLLWQRGTSLFACRVKFMANERDEHQQETGAAVVTVKAESTAPTKIDSDTEEDGSSSEEEGPDPRRGRRTGGRTREFTIEMDAAVESGCVFTAAELLTNKYHPETALTLIPYLNKLQLRFLVVLEQLMGATWALNRKPEDALKRALVADVTQSALGFLQLFCMESFSAERIVYSKLLPTESSTAASATPSATPSANELLVQQHEAEHNNFINLVAGWRERMDHNDMCHDAVILGMAHFASNHFKADKELCLAASKAIGGEQADILTTLAYRASFDALVMMM